MSNSRLNNSTLPYSPVNGSANEPSKILFGASKTSSPASIGTPPWKKRLPITTFSSTRLKSPMGSPRYNLSEVPSLSPSNNMSGDTVSRRRTPTVSGPLLASTRFNVNLGTYTDSKSPGLVSRVVQYEEEKKQSLPIATHQAKYGSPGLFPVVHLFKKDVPVISPKPKRVTVRIASPDSCPYTTQEQRRILIESMAKDNSANMAQNGDHDGSTRSVLDALKEISRKRIHAGGMEYDEEDSRKRQKKEYYNLADSSKRLREESPPHGENNQIAKRARGPCIGPIEASYSSSKILEYMRQFAQSKKPSTQSALIHQDEDSETEESSDDEEEDTSTKKNYSNAETQTLTITKDDKDASTSMEIDESTAKSKTNSSYNIEPRLIQFDEKPMEIHMKNKLSSIFAGIKGVEPVLIPIEKPTLSELPQTDKPSTLVNENAKKQEKHVTFCLPQSASTSSGVQPETVNISPTPVVRDCTTTTASITSPISSVSTPFKDQVDSSKSNFETPKAIPPTQPLAVTKVLFGGQSETPSTPISSPFVSKSNLESSSSIVTPLSSASLQFKGPESPKSLSTFSLATNEKKPLPSSQLLFGSPVARESNNTQLNNSPNKAGGFKFDLQPTTGLSNTTSSNMPFNQSKSNFGTTSASLSGLHIVPSSIAKCSDTATPMFKIGNSSTANPTFNLGSNNTTSVPSITSFGSHSNVSPSANNVTSTTQSGSNNMPSLLASKPADNTFTNSTIAFGGINSNTSINSAPFGTSVTLSNAPSIPTLNFGTPSTTSAVLSGASSAGGFGSITPNASAFGTPTVAPAINVINTSTMFGQTSAPPTFGSANINFGATSSSAFGGQSGPSFTTPSVTTAFGGSSGTTSFGTPTPASSFGASNNAANSFGVPSNSQPAFGIPSTSSMFSSPAKSSTFGTPAVNTPSFGIPATSATTFGALPTNSSTFGTPSTGNTFGSKNAFGNSFGGNNATPFGTTTTSSTFTPSTTATFTFGKTATPTFGNTTTTSSSMFGSNVSSSSKPNGFGTPATTAAPFNFGNNSAFGATTSTASSGFGTSSFGAPTTTSSTFKPPAFGSTEFSATTTANTFGKGSTTGIFSFGTKTTASAFGTTNTFSTNATPSTPFNFAAVTTQPTQFSTTTPSFGNTPSAFGSTTTTTAPSVFGSNPPTFGTSATPFGGNGTPQSFVNTGGFGTNNNSSTNGFTATPTPSFGPANSGINAPGSSVFGNSNNNNAFPSATNNAFASAGFSSTNSNNNNNGAFGGTTSQNSTTFGLGSGFSGASSSGFGSTQPPAQSQAPAFGAASPQSGVFSFGSSNAPAPSTGAGVFAFGCSTELPKPGGFNFASGSTTPFNAASPSTAFGANPQFNPPAQGMFSIGSGSSTSNRQRAQLRGKRR